MLVFDMRYLFPLVPLLLAIASRFLVPSAQWNHVVARKVAVALTVLGVFFSLLYSSSPFRRISRDRQVSCYAAARILNTWPISRSETPTLVTIGAGPFPESGVGWEAGYKTAFFAGYRLKAAREPLTAPDQASSLMTDLDKAAPDAILVWGKPNDGRYVALASTLRSRYSANPTAKMFDPAAGEVGSIFFARQ